MSKVSRGLSQKQLENKSEVMMENYSLFDHSDELICGVDEAGRGPLAGPVTAAAVILDPNRPILGLRDSKKLSEVQRDALALEIKEKALAWAIAECSEQEIDELNILQATMLAMRRACRSIKNYANIGFD